MNITEVAETVLLEIIKKIEQLEEEKRDITADIAAHYKSLELQGFQKPIVREIIKLRKMKSPELEQRERLLAEYKKAVGLPSY